MRVRAGQSLLLLYVAIICCLVPSATGAPFGDFGGTEPQFRNFTTKEGLPSNRVRDVAQDSVGFVWMATDGGLVRFDGTNFKPYPLNKKPQEASDKAKERDVVGERFVMKLLAQGGQLYAGTDMHVFRYEPQTDSFVYIPLFDEQGQEVEGMVRSMDMDQKGELWVSVAGKGVWGGGRHYTFPDLQVFNAAVFVDSHSRVWVASNAGAGELYLFNPSAQRFEPFPVHLAGGEKAVCLAYAFAESVSGQLWVALWDGSLLKVNPLTGEGQKVEGTGAFHPHSLLAYPSDHGERLLIGSDAGLTQLEVSNDKEPLLRRTLVPDKLNPNSIAGCFVYGLIKDKEGGYWITTFHNGVSYMPPAARSFAVYRPSKFRNSLSGKLVSAFAPAPDGWLYVGTEDGGLSLLDPASDHFSTPYKQAMPSSPELDIHALCFDDPYLWIGTYARGVFRLNTHDGALKHFPSPPFNSGKPAESSCYAIIPASNGTIYATSPFSLCRYGSNNERFDFMRELEVNTSNVVEDSHGNLWFSTNGRGVLRYNPHDDVYKQFRHISDSLSLPHDHVNFVAVAPEGRIWAATVNGLAKYEAETDRFVPVTLPKDMPSEMNAIVPDTDGTLWISTTNGLLHYNPANGTCRLYTVSDGLPSNFFMQAACAKAPDGRIYFGTADGFVGFYPRSFDNAVGKAPLVFTDVEVNGHTTLLPGDSRLPAPLESGASLRIGPDERSVGISFASLGYSNSHATRYRYRLEPFDREWVEIEGDGRAIYTNLPSGRYCFRVEVADPFRPDGWNPDPILLYVTVSPPWYLSWWMITLYVMLVLGAIAGGFYWVNLRAARRRRTEIARIRASREKEIQEAKMQFFTVVAHEIRTPVSLILGPLEKVEQTLDTPSLRPVAPMLGPVSNDLSIIHRNASRLLSLVNQLLDFKKVEQNIFSFSYTPTSVIAQSETVAPRFRPTLEQAGITFICRYPSEDFTADIDAEAYNKLLSNLLNNARKFTRSQVSLEITCDRAAGTFCVKVSDDGPGIEPSIRKKIFKPFYQANASDSLRPDTAHGTGLGLSIVSRIVAAHSGTVKVDSSTVAPTFTTFTVTLPLSQHVGNTSREEAKGGVSKPKSDLPSAEATKVKDEDTQEKGEKSPSAPCGGDGCILVVDDNPEMTSFLAESLGENFRVLTAPDGAEALKLINARPQDFSLIVSDWMMPNLSGVELCQRLRSDQNTSHIPFILLTAKTDNPSRIQAMNCGADYFIEKPFSTAFLQACIANLLRLRTQAAERFVSQPLTPLQSVATTPVDSSFMERLTRIIEESFTDPDLNVDTLARKMNMSRSSFYAKIKTLADITPNELIELTRLKRAAVLLSAGNLLVGEVAALVGYNSSSYFSQRFKAQFSITPAAFMSQTKK